MTQKIKTQPISADAFSVFGDIIEPGTTPARKINQGLCDRYHDLATLTADGDKGYLGVSIFQSDVPHFPFKLDMMERHPLGSQTFIPMSFDPFLVIVAPDDNDRPGEPLAFRTTPGQGINYHPNVWHGVLTPLYQPGLFTVIDRIGDGDNLDEYWFNEPYEIQI